jgi:hypothetical protein
LFDRIWDVNSEHHPVYTLHSDISALLCQLINIWHKHIQEQIIFHALKSIVGLFCDNENHVLTCPVFALMTDARTTYLGSSVSALGYVNHHKTLFGLACQKATGNTKADGCAVKKLFKSEFQRELPFFRRRKWRVERTKGWLKLVVSIDGIVSLAMAVRLCRNAFRLRYVDIITKRRLIS